MLVLFVAIQNVVGHQSNKFRNISSVDGEGLYPVFESWLRYIVVCGIGQWLTEYNAALACICFMLFLGFVDDVLDIPWRV